MMNSNKTLALALAAALLAAQGASARVLNVKSAPNRTAPVRALGPLQGRAGASFAPLKTGGFSMTKGLELRPAGMTPSVIPGAVSVSASKEGSNGAQKLSSENLLQKAARWFSKKEDKSCPNPDDINDPVERRYEDGRDSFDGSGEEERRTDSPVSSDIEGKGPYGPLFLTPSKAALSPAAKTRRGSARAVRAPNGAPSGPEGTKEPGMLQAVQTVLEASVVAATAYATQSPAATYSALVLMANLHYYPNTLKEMSSGDRTLGIVSNMILMGKMTMFSNPLSLVMGALPAYAVVGKAAVMTITHPLEVMAGLVEKLAAKLEALAAASVTLSKAATAAVFGGLFGAFIAAVTLTPEVLYAPARPVIGIVKTLVELLPARLRKAFYILSGTAAAVAAAYHIVPVMSFLASAMVVLGTFITVTFKGTALLGAAIGAPVAWAESSRGGVLRGVQKAFAAVIEFAKKVESKVRPS